MTTAGGNVSLQVVFYGPSSYPGQGYTFYTRFNDTTTFLWNPAFPPSTAKWSGRFGNPLTSLPAAYLSIVIMNNQAGTTWAWPSLTGTTPNTFSPPTGQVTLGALMNSMYAASTATISPEQYQDVCGQGHDGTGPCTVGGALEANAAAWGYPGQWVGVQQESSTLCRVLC